MGTTVLRNTRMRKVCQGKEKKRGQSRGKREGQYDRRVKSPGKCDVVPNKRKKREPGR